MRQTAQATWWVQAMVLGLLGLLAVLVAACADDADDEVAAEGDGEEATTEADGDDDAADADGDEDTGEEAEGAVDLPDDAPGVDDETIRVGIPVFDVGADQVGVSEAAFPSVDEQETMWQAPIDAVNEDGIHGRVIEPVYVPYNSADAADMIRACNEMVEDEEVFAVVAWSFYGDASTCVAERHERPLFNMEGIVGETFDNAEGLVFTKALEMERNLEVMARELDAQGELDGETLAVVTSELGDDLGPTRDALLPTLEELGHDVDHVVELSSDFGTAQGQMGPAIDQMRQDEVSSVFFATNSFYMSRFAEVGDGQGFTPRYLASDFAGALQEEMAAAYPDSYEGLGVTSHRYGEQETDIPMPDYDRACIEQFEAAGGPEYERGWPNYQMATRTCSTVDVIAQGLEHAGDELTTATFSGGMQSVGEFQMGYGGTGSFGPGKYDAADEVRLVDFDHDCKCWVPRGDFTEAPR